MSTGIIITVLIVFFVLVLTAVYFMLKKLLPQKKEDDQSSLILLQNQIQGQQSQIQSQMGELRHALDSHLRHQSDQSTALIERLTKLDEANKQVVGFADQLKSLQDILKNPKQRGVVGEYYLKTVLDNVLPPSSFKMQYAFKNGDIVDAAIFIKDKIIPVDSKFSLENYNRFMETREDSERKRLEESLRQDIKNRIDETSKYIKPSENTMEFAFMFIPSEALYYDLLINKVGSMAVRDLIEYATAEKKVIIVSPTSFLAYLQTVLQGLKALQIEESAKEIQKRVADLGRHLSSYETYMKKLGTHLGTTVGMYNSAYKELSKIDKDVLKISGEGISIEAETVDKPASSYIDN